MTTYRERREARAERLRGWSESRSAAADAAHAEVHRIGDQIPFGQPILVGHHSERGHRRDIGRMQSGMQKTVEHAKMADRHSSRADNIEAQLRESIYDDDPDAIEQLEAKLARLEAQREQQKAANAAYRSEHRAELKTMTVYQRSEAVPFASYSLTNLSGNISRVRERLERLKRSKEIIDAGGRGHGRQMESRFGGTCPDCGQKFAKGETIIYYRLTREAIHAQCPTTEGDQQ